MNTTAHVDEEIHGKVMEVDLHGKLAREDYEKFVPETERLIKKHGKIRILVKMHDFHGWTAGALWEDLKWDAKHYTQIERLAIVGDKTWHKWMTMFYRPFKTAKVRYFTMDQLDTARAWVKEPADDWDGSEATGIKQP